MDDRLRGITMDDVGITGKDCASVALSGWAQARVAVALALACPQHSI